jgi:hypothetical protein
VVMQDHLVASISESDIIVKFGVWKPYSVMEVVVRYNPSC